MMEMFHLVCERGSCLVLIVSSGIAANSSARDTGFPTLQNVASSKTLQEFLQEFPSEKAFASAPHGAPALGKPIPVAVKHPEHSALQGEALSTGPHVSIVCRENTGLRSHSFERGL